MLTENIFSVGLGDQELLPTATLPNLLVAVPSVQPEAPARAIPQRDRCVGSHLRARGARPSQEHAEAEGVYQHRSGSG